MYVPSKGRTLIVFYPGTEYEGAVIENGKIVLCGCGKYPGTYEILRKDVEITMIL